MPNDRSICQYCKHLESESDNANVGTIRLIAEPRSLTQKEPNIVGAKGEMIQLWIGIRADVDCSEREAGELINPSAWAKKIITFSCGVHGGHHAMLVMYCIVDFRRHQ